MVPVPTQVPPIHPGEMLLEEFLKPLGVTQASFAAAISVSYVRLNEIVNGRRSVTADTALRFARALGTSPELWLNLQHSWDLWHAARAPAAKTIARIAPLVPEADDAPGIRAAQDLARNYPQHHSPVAPAGGEDTGA